MQDGDRPYVTFLVRLWKVEAAETPIWRASARDAQTGKEFSFANVSALCAYLQQMVSGAQWRDEHSRASDAAASEGREN